jgi:23S rRNA (adenine2503-C2)-methyltransferase
MTTTEHIAEPSAEFNSINPVNFYSLTMPALKELLKGLGKEQFRAQQLYRWVYDKRVLGLDQMSNLSKDFRVELSKIINFDLPKVVSHLKSVDGTQKFLFDIGQGNTVEAVLIPSDDRLTLCISSEVGCNMACKFCFTGKQKLKRRLQSHEIVGQLIEIEDILARDAGFTPGVTAEIPEGERFAPRPPRVTNIVFMGMGEPLDNCEAVFSTIDILCEDFGRNFSRRKITVSTSGLVPEMWRVIQSKTRLAVSLNGYDDASRTEIMPINKKYPLEMLLEECRKYNRETGDLVTFEYVLLKGVTDQIEHARKLAKLLKTVPSKINIIPFNEHPGSEFTRPSDDTIQAFHSELMRLGAHVLLRRTMGRDIFAACGQLTSEFENKPRQMDISNSRIGGTSRVRNFSSRQPSL